jgi:hypothetical protein
MTQHQHTQGPWRVFTAFVDAEIVTDRPTANETESIVQFKGQRNALANARFIVRACNAHDDMLEALELCVDCLADLARLDDGTPSISALDKVRAAIAKATG